MYVRGRPGASPVSSRPTPMSARAGQAEHPSRHVQDVHRRPRPAALSAGRAATAVGRRVGVERELTTPSESVITRFASAVSSSAACGTLSHLRRRAWTRPGFRRGPAWSARGEHLATGSRNLRTPVSLDHVVRCCWSRRRGMTSSASTLLACWAYVVGMGRLSLALVEFPADERKRALPFLGVLLGARVEARTEGLDRGWQNSVRRSAGLPPSRTWSGRLHSPLSISRPWPPAKTSSSPTR
jgi:hypothetical protein